MKHDNFTFLRGSGAFFALLCATVLTPSALLAEKTTNTYTKASNTTSVTWANAGLPDAVTTTDGSDISIKIDYADGYEKYQQLNFPDVSASGKLLYLDSVVGGKYHNLYMSKGQIRYATVNDPSPFEGFWSLNTTMADSGCNASGIYLPDVGSSDVRTIGSVYTRSRFQFGVAPGCEAVLDYPFGLGMFEVNRSMNSKSVGGKLTVENSPGPYSVVRVRNGTLGIVGDSADTTAPVPGAWARFDASVEDSLTFNGTAITQWRDADGRNVSANKSTGSPTLYTDPETGLKSVNFGSFVNYSGTAAGNSSLHGVGSKLQLSEARNDVAEMFVVFKDNDSKKGTYPTIAGDAFPRKDNPNTVTLFKGWTDLPAELAMGEFRLDGQAVIPDLTYDLSRRMNVVSASYRSGGGSVGYLAAPDNDGHENRTRGGVKIAEIIFYTNTLTSAERRHNNEYLMQKWFGHGIRDYGAIMIDNGKTLSVESGTARVREISAKSFVKTGAGTLEVETISTNLTSLTVSGGAVRFASTLARPASPQPAADPFAWFDADDSTSFDTFTSNYTGNAGTLESTNYTFITSWRDKRGNGFSLARAKPGSHANYANGADEAAYPTLDSETGAHPMVDLGPWAFQVKDKTATYGNFGWINGTSGLSTWLCLYTNDVVHNAGSTRQGFVVFYKTNSRGNPINSSNWYLRNGTQDVPSQMFVETGHAHGIAVGGHWTYDGVTIDQTSVSLLADGRAHLGSFQFETSLPVDIYGADMGIGGGGAGGCKIAEVILYDRLLNEQERLDTERYLMAKWNCGTHLADKVPSVGTITFNNGASAVIDADVNMTIGSVTGSGTVAKKGTGTATVGSFAQDVSALALEDGALDVGSGVTIADGAVLDVYIDADGNVVGTASVEGTLTVAGGGTLRVHAPEGVSLAYGDYPIVTATSVAFANPLAWTVDFPGLKGAARVSYDADLGAFVLRVYPKALTIIVR